MTMLLVSGASCGSAPESPGIAAGTTARTEPIVEVETAVVRRGPISQRISASGTLEARRESRIGAEVQGRITRVHVDEGDRVEAGDLLVEIDPEPYEIALRQAGARLDLARAQRHQVEADLVRARSLQARNVVAPQEIERLETSLLVARAEERAAGEAVRLASHQLERTRLHAPWAGSVAGRLADEGSTALVQPQTIVLVLQESGHLEARAAIPESQRAPVHVGDVAAIHVEGLPAPIHTRVSAVAASIDPATRTYSVRMPVDNQDHRLKAGIFALIEITPRERSDVLLIPRKAIRSDDGRTRVFTIVDGRSTPRAVELGMISGSEAEIVSGLEEGETLITGEAAGRIASGMRVRATPRDERS